MRPTSRRRNTTSELRQERPAAEQKRLTARPIAEGKASAYLRAKTRAAAIATIWGLSGAGTRCI
jgi:hypothetical protein